MTNRHNPLSLDSASILNRINEGYLIWVSITPHIAKGARYTIGSWIENKFLDLLELSYVAYFTEKEKKGEKIAECVDARHAEIFGVCGVGGSSSQAHIVSRRL